MWSSFEINYSDPDELLKTKTVWFSIRVTFQSVCFSSVFGDLFVFNLSTTVLYILLIIVLPGAGCSQGSGPV